MVQNRFWLFCFFRGQDGLLLVNSADLCLKVKHSLTWCPHAYFIPVSKITGHLCWNEDFATKCPHFNAGVTWAKTKVSITGSSFGVLQRHVWKLFWPQNERKSHLTIFTTFQNRQSNNHGHLGRNWPAVLMWESSQDLNKLSFYICLTSTNIILWKYNWQKIRWVQKCFLWFLQAYRAATNQITFISIVSMQKDFLPAQIFLYF